MKSYKIRLILIVSLIVIPGLVFARMAHAAEITEKAETTTEITTETKDTQDIRFKLMQAILKLKDTKLPAKKHCDFHIAGSSQRPRLGEWIAWNLSFFEANQTNSVSTFCQTEKKGKGLVCRLDFNADSKGESPWGCGFSFSIDSKMQKIQPDSLSCTGSC